MKFEFCGKKKTYTTFNELIVGDVFRSPEDTSLYIKTDSVGTVLRLDSGELLDFPDNDEVIPVEATIKWRDK